MKLVIKHHFDAAHYLLGYKGKCANLHGHRWVVEITITGDKNEETGMLVDFAEIKEAIDCYDHKSLNEIFSNPTAENIAEGLKRHIRNLNSHIHHVNIKLWESPDCYVEV